MLATRTILRVASCIVAALLLVGTGSSQETTRETYNAFAVVMGTSNPPLIAPGTSVTLQINITRWSTEEEVDDLQAVLVEKGHEGLVEALKKQKETGWVRARGMEGLTNFPRETLRYARQFVDGDKRRIVLALDRPIEMAEAVYRPRWNRYDMTLLVMDVDSEGKGLGQLAMAVRLSVDVENDRLVVETFGTEPVRLNSIRRTK